MLPVEKLERFAYAMAEEIVANAPLSIAVIEEEVSPSASPMRIR